MKKILMTPENKRIVVDLDKDIELYGAPRNPPNTGTKYTSGIDIHLHISRSGKEYFYSYSWSMWQGSENIIELLSREQVEDFLIKKASSCGWDSIHESEEETLKKYGFNIFEENA